MPTWNYVIAHAYGRLVIHEDPAWLEANVRRLVALHESTRDEPWAVDDAPPVHRRPAQGIVGVELLIDRLEAKSKLSQNRSAADVDGVIAGLEADGESASPPRCGYPARAGGGCAFGSVGSTATRPGGRWAGVAVWGGGRGGGEGEGRGIEVVSAGGGGVAMSFSRICRSSGVVDAIG